MKKLLLIVVLAVLPCLTIQAQSDSGDFTISPQIGVNLSTYSSDATYNSRISFAAGVIGEYYFSDRWSLRSGLLYNPMGAEDGLNIVDKLNYLTIPLNANWHFGKKRNWYLNFGPAVSFLLKAESEFPDGNTLDVKDVVSSLDVGLVVGIGYKFDVAENFQLNIDYQGYGGFIDIDDANNLPFSITNSRSSFNIGGVFSL
ncbi:PorT family protein [Winogradskyella sp. DF17]|uniref:PorT family protein n=1 Tax=Winogradskyella pelagia TaxID=2819984 RepID=A0ABS3T0S1_9FLAO|nr:porin family protein [Winogradskyella sp. DF17]MBO3116337.1 PorT family protein [Winogradskyella sp. DF17]